MAKDINIIPGDARIDFSGASASTISLRVLDDGTVTFEGAAGTLFTIADSLTGVLMSVNDISGLPIFTVNSNDSIVMGEYNTNALVVSGTSVGVRTNSPNHPLDVRGDSDSIVFSADHTSFDGRQAGFPGRFMIGPQGSGYPQIGYNFTTSSGVFTKIAADTAWRMTFGAGNRMDFSYAAAGSGTFTWTDYMTIDDTGNVGIGTTNPTQKLDVNGNIGLSGNGTGNRWILLNETNTYAGTLRIQAGGGSAAYGGAINMYGHSHATNPGDVAVGISSGSGGSFRVNSTGIDTGTDLFIVKSSGNVGIGTTSPAFTAGSGLEIQRTGTATLRLDSGSFSTELRAYTDGTFLGQLSSAYLDLGTNNTTRVRIDGNGNVGIGTTSPYADLHVAGATSSASGVGRGILITDSVYPRLVLENTTNLTGERVLDLFLDNGLGKFRALNDSAGSVTVDNILVMNVANGYVGLGVSSPTNPLHVSKDATVNAVAFFDSLNADGYGVAIRTADTGNDKYALRVDGNSGSTPIIYASNAGNVGIGTTSPTQKLHVVGSGFFTGDESIPNGPTSSGIYIGKSVGNDDRKIELVAPSTGNTYIDFTEPSVDYKGRIIYSNVSERFTFYTNATQKMALESNGTLRLHNYGSGTFTGGTPTYRLAADASGNIMELAIGAGAVDGSGTANTVPLWLDSDTLGDSIMTQVSGQIRVDGTTTLALSTVGSYALDVSNTGGISLALGTNASGGYIQTFSSQPLYLNTQGNNIITGAGNLEVNGNLDVVQYIRHIGDTDTYIQFADDLIYLRAGARNMVRLVEGVTDYLYLDADEVDITNGDLRLRRQWNNSTPAGNSLYSSDGTDGFAIGVGTVQSTWFAYDSTSGMTNAIGVYNDGSRVLIGESGGVDFGIGLTTPDTKLHVYDATTDFVAYFESGDAGGYIGLIDSTTSSNTHVGIGAVGDTINLRSGNASRMVIDAVGEVRFNAYGTGAITGTTAYGLAVDASGNIIETANPLTALDLQAVTDNGATTTNSITISGAATITARDFIDNLDSNYYLSPSTTSYLDTVYFSSNNTTTGYVQIGEKFIYGFDDASGNWFEFRSNNVSTINGNGLKLTNSAYLELDSTASAEFLYTDAGGVVNSGSWSGVTLSQFTDDITSAVTLQVVTDNGNTTTNDITLNNLYVAEYVYHNGDTDTNLRFQTNNVSLSANGNIVEWTSQAWRAGDNIRTLGDGSNRWSAAYIGTGGVFSSGKITANNSTHGDGHLNSFGSTGVWGVYRYGNMLFNNTSDTGNIWSIHPRGDSRLSIGHSSTSNLTGTGTEKYFADTYDIVTITSGGSVGIGDSTPSERFVVDGGAIVWKGALVASQTSAGVLDRSANVLRIRAYGATSGTGELAFRTGGGGGAADSEAMRIDENGYVGIGTTAPDELLEVDGGASYGYLKISSTNNTSRFMRMGMVDAVNHTIEANGASTYLTFKTEGTERLRIDSTGNVGIGTVSPMVKLDVRGGASIGTATPKSDWYTASYYGLEINGGGAIWGRATDIHLSSNYYVKATPTAQDTYMTTNEAIDLWMNNATGDLSVRMAASGTADTAITWATPFIIKNSGNVGIGTTAPSVELEVVGDVEISSELAVGTSVALKRVTYGSEFRANGASAQIFFGRDGSSIGSGAIGADANYALNVYGDADFNIRLGVKQTGQLTLPNYGIGTFTGTATQRLGVDSSGNVIEIPIGAGAVDGAGTTGYIPKWTDSDTLGDSIIQETGGDILVSGGNFTIVNTTSSGNTVFAVDGTFGRLFSVTDDLTGSIFSVNTIAGLPVMEAFADYTVTLGSYSRKDFYLDGSTGYIGLNNDTPSVQLDVTGDISSGDGTVDNYIRVYNSDATYAELRGYGVLFNRTVSYLRPTANGTSTLYVGADGTNDWAAVNVYTDGSTDFTWNNNIIATQTWSDLRYLQLAGGTMTGNIVMGNNLIEFGPNDTWSKSLFIGNKGDNSTVDDASIGVTNGNLHIDAANSFVTILNYYAGTAGVAFGTGASGYAAWMSAGGDLYKNTSPSAGGDRYFHDGYHPNADVWTTSRTITIGSTGKAVNGSANVSWTLGEIGAADASHNHTLDSLSNVTITSNTSGEILKWNGSAWINNTLAEAGISAVGHNHTHADITDFDTEVNTLIDTRVNKAFVDALNVDADTLDGLNSTVFARLDQDNIFTDTAHQMRINTSDGSDTGSFIVASAGAASSTRGAYIALYGNEHASLPGDLTLQPGSTGNLQFNGVVSMGSEATALFINGSNQVGYRELGSAAFVATSTFAASSHTHTHADITDFDTEVSAIITADVDKAFIDALNVDADTLDSLNSTQFLRSDANDSFSGILTGTNTGENLIVGGIRGTAKGSQTGQYLHLYERVHIGGPSGWGAATHNAPANGLSVWGSVDIGMNGTGVIQLDGTTIVDATRDLINVTNTNWDSAYNDIITGASFNTGNGIITLTRRDLGTVTVDIDGRYLTGNQSITLTGDVTGSGTVSITTTIAASAVEGSMLNNNVISSQTELASGLVSTDELLVSDAGTIKRMDISVIQSYMQSNLAFTNNAGTVTSVAISGTDGIDVDSGSPITTSGTITLGLSAIPNSSLANSSVSFGGVSVSLGGSDATPAFNLADATGYPSANINHDSTTGFVPNEHIDHTTVSISTASGLTGGGTIAATRTLGIDYEGTNNFIDFATNLEGTAIAAGDTIVYHDATDNNVKKGFVSDLPFTNNAGTVTSVGITAGALIDVAGSPVTTSGSITVDVDLSELTDMTAGVDGSLDEMVLLDSGLQRRKLLSEINLGEFNNNLGWTSNAGTVTSINLTAGALIDVSGGPVTTSGSITVDVDLSELTDMTASMVATDEFVVLDGGLQRRKAINEIPISLFSDVTITSIASGEILKWNGSAWINNTLAEAGISAVGHNHTTSDITNLSSYTGFDARYYTETEINNFFSGSVGISGYNKTNWDSAYTYSQVGHLPLAGGTLTGDLNIVKNEPWLTLDSPSTGGNNVEQAAGISLGESGTKGSAALHLTYTGDGKGWIGMGTVTSAIPAFKALTMLYNGQNVGVGGDYSASYAVQLVGTTNITSTLRVAGELTLATASNQASETTALMINGSSIVGTRELGSLAFLSSITLTGDVTGSGTSSITTTISADVVGANELNVTGNGTVTEFLRSDGDGTFTWAEPSLNDLANVTITSNTSGEILKWSGSAWINNTLAEAGIAATSHNHTLDSLSNVTITSNTSGEILKWSGSAWINNTLAEAGVSAVGHVHAASDITSGTFNNARIAQSNVTQHQAALTIAHTQLTGFNLVNLSDTNIPTLTAAYDGAVLAYNNASGDWVPATGLNLTINLDDLADVSTSGAFSSQVLRYNGTTWQPFSSSFTITGGNGLTGGGSTSLGGSLTLNVGAGTGISVDASNVNVNTNTAFSWGATHTFTASSGIKINGGNGLELAEQASSPVALSGYGRLYAKTDGNLYYKNDASTETNLTSATAVNNATITIGAGAGLSTGGDFTTNQSFNETITLDLDYAGADNFILAAGAGVGTPLTSWHLALSDASNNVDYYNLSDLPFITGNQTITLSGDVTGSGTVSITTNISANVVGANELNVTGNGTTSQYLRSDGDGTFTWVTPPDTNTTYSAGAGLNLVSTTFSVNQGYSFTWSGTHIWNDTGSIRMNDDKTLAFGTGSDATFDYDSGSTEFRLDLNATDWYINDTSGALVSRFLFDISTGDFHADGDITAYSSSVGSDIRLKDDIVPITYGLDTILKMNPVSFKWKRNGITDLGFIAQEVEELTPELVKTGLMRTDYKTLKYQNITAILTKAVQEQQAIIDELKEEIEKLKNGIN